eukprot:scaffold1365_cov163-Ochromonas_danica.AAC.16
MSIHFFFNCSTCPLLPCARSQHDVQRCRQADLICLTSSAMLKNCKNTALTMPVALKRVDSG